MKKKLWFILFALILFVSCSVDSDIINNVSIQKEIKLSQKSQGVDLMISKTNEFIRNKTNATRSARTTSCDDTIKLINYTTKSFEIKDSNSKARSVECTNRKDSVTVYLLEYENNGCKGFSIGSDDFRLPHILALSENGSLADTLYNEGLSYYIDNLEEVCKEAISDFNKVTKGSKTREIFFPSKPPIIQPKKEYFSTGDDWICISLVEVPEGYVTKNIEPLLKTAWHQGAPYNNKCNNGNSPAGCVPIATAQIMAYFKKPYDASFWNELTVLPSVSSSDALLSDRVSSLLATVGKGVNVKYGEKSSSADFKDAASYLNSVGIDAKFINTIDTGIIRTSIYNAKPLILPILCTV